MVDPRHDPQQIQLAAVFLQHLAQRLNEPRAFVPVPPGIVAWWEIMYDTFNAEFIVFNIYPQLIPSPHDPIHNRALMMISLTSPNSANACYGVFQMPRTAALRVASGEISQLSCCIFTEARPLSVCQPRSPESVPRSVKYDSTTKMAASLKILIFFVFVPRCTTFTAGFFNPIKRVS